jgi:hypothetical protein
MDDNIKIGLRETGFYVDWIHMTQSRNQNAFLDTWATITFLSFLLHVVIIDIDL